MKFICWFSIFLFLQLDLVQCGTEKFLAKLRKLRAEFGITHDYLEFDNSLYEEFLKATNLPPFTVAQIHGSKVPCWNNNVILCLTKGYGMVRCNTGIKMQDGNKEDNEKVYDTFKAQMIEENFRDMLYDIQNIKVGIKFYYKEGQDTRILITFRVLETEDFVVWHTRPLRAKLTDKEDPLYPFLNTHLNKIARWAIEGKKANEREVDEKTGVITISPDLVMINVKIQNHKEFPIPLRVMKTLDSLVHEESPNKTHLLMPTAQRMCVYKRTFARDNIYVVPAMAVKHKRACAAADESRNLVIIIEIIDITGLRNQLWTEYMKIRTDKIAYLTHGKSIDLLDGKGTDQELDEIAIGVLTSAKYGFELRMLIDDNVSLDPRVCAGKFLRVIFRHKEFAVASYLKNNFQYTMLREVLLQDMLLNSMTNKIINNKYTEAGFAFHVVTDTYAKHFWRLCIVLERPKTIHGNSNIP